MKWAGLLLASALLAHTFPMPGPGSAPEAPPSGLTYYVSPTGNNGNDGLSPGTAWQTVTRVNNAQGSLNPGDTVLFERGGVWNERLRPTTSGTSGSPITYGAYGSGALPVITARGDIVGWDTPGNWSDQTGNVWRLATSFNPQRMWFDGVEFLAAPTGGSIDATNRFFYSGGNLDVYATENPATAYADLDGSFVANATNYAVFILDDSWITLQEIDFRGGLNSVEIEASGANVEGIVVQNAALGLDAGQSGVFVRSFSDAFDIIGTQIANNTIDSGSRLLAAFDVTTPAHGVNLTDGVQDSDVYGNTIQDWNQSGIVMNGTTANRATIRNEFRDNEVSAPNIQGGRCFAITNDPASAGPANASEANLFYRNYCHDLHKGINFGGAFNEAFYNVIANKTNAAWRGALQGDAAGIKVNVLAETRANNLKVWNNVISGMDESCIYVQEYVTTPANVFSNVVQNNLLEDCSKDPLGNGVEGAGTVGVAMTIGSNIGANTLTHNLGYSGAVANLWDYRGTVMDTATFNAQVTDTVNDNLGEQDPQLVLPGGAADTDYSIAGTSPAVDAATDLGFTSDYLQNPVPLDTGPDIGAFEVAFVGGPTPLYGGPGTDDGSFEADATNNCVNDGLTSTEVATTVFDCDHTADAADGLESGRDPPGAGGTVLEWEGKFPNETEVWWTFRMKVVEPASNEFTAYIGLADEGLGASQVTEVRMLAAANVSLRRNRMQCSGIGSSDWNGSWTEDVWVKYKIHVNDAAGTVDAWCDDGAGDAAACGDDLTSATPDWQITGCGTGNSFDGWGLLPSSQGTRDILYDDVRIYDADPGDPY